MRILITGGTGCLGSNLVEHWVPAGHEILALDNFATSSREVFPPALPGFELVEGDVASLETLQRCVERFRPGVIVHAAASYTDPDDWREDTSTNVLGAINVARVAEAHGVSLIVNFQTALCYGRPSTVPIPITAPLAPFTSYGISKVAAESYLALSTVPVVSLRLANIAGPRLAIGPIPTFYQRLKDGKDCFCSATVRDFLDMSDFLSLMDRILEGETQSGTYNVSTGVGHTIREVYDEVRKHLGLAPEDAVRVVEPGADDVREVVLDPASTIADFGWRARVGFEETIERQLRWYDAHGISSIFSHLTSPTKDRAEARNAKQ